MVGGHDWMRFGVGVAEERRDGIAEYIYSAKGRWGDIGGWSKWVKAANYWLVGFCFPFSSRFESVGRYSNLIGRT